MDWGCSQEAGNDTRFSCSSQNQLLRVGYCRHERKHQYICGSRKDIIFEWTLENVVEQANTPTRQHATFIETHCLVCVRVFIVLTHHSIQPLTITFPIPDILLPLIVSYILLPVSRFQNNAHLSQHSPSFCSRCNCASCIFLITKNLSSGYFLESRGASLVSLFFRCGAVIDVRRFGTTQWSHPPGPSIERRPKLILSIPNT